MRRSGTRQLTHAGLVLSQRGARRGALAVLLLLLAAALVAAALAWWLPRPPPAAPAEPHALQQALERSQLALRMAEARGRELEHQVESLNQQLRACQEELGFFRKSRDNPAHR